MKGPIIWAALLGALAVYPTTTVFAQQPQGVRATNMQAPTPERWTNGAHHAPQVPERAQVEVAQAGNTDEFLAGSGVKRLERSSVKRETAADVQANIDEEAQLLPVLYPGFWLIPPGGITRFLISPPVPIDPERKVPFAACQEAPTTQP